MLDDEITDAALDCKRPPDWRQVDYCCSKCGHVWHGLACEHCMCKPRHNEEEE